MKLLILTGYDDAMASVGDVLAPSKVAYAARHGHDYHCHRDYHTDTHPGWQKIALLREFLPRYDAVLWLDADTLVTGPDVVIEDLTIETRRPGDPEVFWVSRDHSHCSDADFPHHFCTGNFLLENAPAAYRLLDLVEARAHWANTQLWEQSAMQEEHRENPDLRPLVKVLDRRVLNSVPFPELPEPWQPGDFLCHFSGIANHIRLEYIARVQARLAAVTT
jgi:hypothetical protein